MAFLYGIQLAIYLGLQNFTLEGDSLTVVQAIQLRSKSRAPYGIVLDLIFSTLSNLSCQVQHIYRSTNSIADGLALIGHLSSNESRFVNNVPMSLMNSYLS
ncbi:hypothetical protein HS088_TW20G00382 [Tripterygium wilfordii]|uniref:RNase H type-1 domain-containing protein n=1 Tax=Tripterygium wilfordii TaxID=458696 RepID=A0A7J7C7C3_TRIWF|nr:hypothetical protein HS088_TW20G00382 [Tripterygium wilfordii]